MTNDYTYEYNDSMNDYEVFKKDSPEVIDAVFKSSDIRANVWKESYTILLSESKREWRVLNDNYDRVAIFRYSMDAYVWVDLATGRYSLERRDN